MNSLKRLCISLAIAGAQTIHGQPAAFFKPGIFLSPDRGAYVETNLTLAGASLNKHREEGRFRSSVNITTLFFRDSSVVKAERYNLHGPFFADSLQSPSFIDCQRYYLPAGSYRLEMKLTDNDDLQKKELKIRHDFVIDFRDDRIETSLIQPLESFRKTLASGPLTKSGYELVPYNTSYYPESTTDLAFYFEVYHADKILGKNSPFVIEWYLETSADSSRLSLYGSFSRETARPLNAMLAKTDISKLRSGDYALVIEVKDRNNTLLRKEKYYFTRLNRRVEVSALLAMDEKALQAMFVGKTENVDTLTTYVECLWPIADNTDKKKIVDESVKKEPASMKRFVVDFWQRRAGDTANPVQMWADYYQRVLQATALFRCGKQKGYYTERGRVFLQYGTPNQRTEQPNEPNTFPYEIWQYYRITDGTNGHFFSNRKFVFVNKNIGDDCYDLVHSDMRGEINNPRWQFEVTRRNFEGKNNSDNTTPGNTEYNQFKEIYENPR